MIRRRDFIRTGLVTAGALTFGPAFWRDKFAAAKPAKLGAGPYGPLQGPDLNGISLPKGFQSRLIAQGDEPVGTTGYVFPIFPDGAATFATPDGGWILAINAEIPAPAPGGGASAIRFRADGSVADAYRILGDTSTNCSGGATPWGTWLSCEEINEGRVWECDPRGEKPAVVRPALGVFNHEAAAVDPGGERVYLTEDKGDGGFYRFTPDDYPDLSKGVLEIAVVANDGVVTWKRVPDPLAQSTPTRAQVPGYTKFKRGEGIWFDSGIVYVATSTDGRVWAYNATLETIDLIYDEQSMTDPPLTDTDNVTVSRLSGDVFVCEDSGDLDMGIITPEGEVSRFMKLTGPQHGDPDTDASSELTGPCWDPSATRMYVSSQRAAVVGQLYEITGPFRRERPKVPTPPGLRIEAPATRSLGRFRRSGLPVTILVDKPVRLSAALHAKLGPLPKRGGAGISAKRKNVRLARQTALPAGRGRVDVRLRPSRKVRARLRRRKVVTAKLTVRAVDAGGNARTHTQVVTMRSGGRRPKKS